MKRSLDEKEKMCDGCKHHYDNEGFEDYGSSDIKRRRMAIEKRRRDKINTYLNQLSHLVPAAAEKAGASKIEKAEILEMTVEYVRKLIQSDQCNNVKGKGQKDNSEKEREKGFWTCAKELERFLQCNLSGENKKPLLEGVRQHLHNYARQNLKETAWVNSEHNPKKTRSPTSEQRPSVLTDTAMNEVALNHNLLFKKICMDFLKNNAEFFSGGS